MRKAVFIIPIFLVLVFSLLASADEGEVRQKKTPTKTQVSEEYEVPEWVKRTNIGIQAGTDIQPTYFLESIQPLFCAKEDDRVLFNHLRISSTDYRTLYNIGLGIRKIFKNSYLLGTNIFYDYQDLHKHQRAGLGLEAMADNGLEARLNTYFKVSSIRMVNDAPGGQEFEEVANGLDWELGSRVPYLPFLRIYGGGEWYSFEKFHNKYGWKGRLEYNPIKNSRIVFEMSDDNKTGKPAYKFEGAVTLNFTSFALRDIKRDLKFSQNMFEKVNLQDHVLDRVVRDFDITVIKSTKTKGGLTVEAGKS
jgi:hypothetical protein